MSASCTSCGRQNREGRRFCAACGTPLHAVVVCATCGAGNEQGESFCGGCGAALADTVIDEAPSERKQLTVLFADVQGSMDLQQDLDPEVWAAIMSRFVGILAEGVRRYGGTVDKFTGDGIMALFGAPLAQEDHARRACHAAVHLTKVIAGYARELHAAQGLELCVRIGLNSGEVVVGRVGQDLALDPTALGHTVGLAQRMEAMAEPGAAYLTEYTARLVEGWFRLRDLGPMPVKGVRTPLRVFVVDGPVEPGVSARRETAAGTAALVGRERELAQLDDALTTAAGGQAQVVGVVGEAGVGKSRLCEEFVRAAIARGINVRHTTGVSHGREVPLLPVLALLRDYFGITEADEGGAARDKVTHRVLDLDPGADDDLPLLFDFLAIADPARPLPPVAPEARMRRVFEALRRITQRRSEREVLVLLVEDLHWFDPQSESFLERLIESFPGSRTLVVTNFRPEFSARWMRHSYYRQLPLAPLQDSAVGELLGGLLGLDLSLAPLLGFVQERTGGNPFFVEEVIRALIEDGTLAGGKGSYRVTRPLDQVKVPPKVQAVLAARIDRLTATHKATLQAAAVIGRTFGVDVLAHAAGSAGETLDDALFALCGAELLQEIGSGATAEYRFWHPLTQEVAYGSLLIEHRGRLHSAVARAIIEVEGDRLDERAAIVASHFERAGETLEAARWNTRAAAWALRSDVAEAQRRWRATLDLLSGHTITEEGIRIQVQTLIRLIQWGARTGVDPTEAEQLFARGRELAAGLDDLQLRTMLVYAAGSARFVTNDVAGGVARYREAAALGASVEDAAFRSVLANSLCISLGYAGPLAEALTWGHRAVEVLSGDPDEGVAIVGYSAFRVLSYRSVAYARMGRLSEARADAERALSMARPRPEPENLVFALAALCETSWLAGEPDGMLGWAAEALRVGEDTGNFISLALALDSLTRAHLPSGEPGQAATTAERALVETRTHRVWLCLEPTLLAHLAAARLALGDLVGATEAAAESVASARQRQTRVFECLALLTRAQVGRASGAADDDVTADLDAALALVRETGARGYEPFIREELARLHNDGEELQAALRLFEKSGARGHARRLASGISTD